MEKLRILFTGDSITDVNRTDMVRMTEEWMSRAPNATPQQREEAVDWALGCGYPLLVASQLGAQEPGRYEFSSPATGWWIWTPVSSGTASTCGPTSSAF